MTGERDFVVGDVVEMVGNEERQFSRVGNSYGTLPVRPGQQLTVTRVYEMTMTIRGLVLRTGGGNMVEASLQVNKERFQLVDPNRPVPPPPRKLGRKPDDTPELTHIDVDDPRIQWLFDDLGTYADGKNWCPQYDELCREMGIPGRPREFNVTRTMNGIQIRAAIKARSQAEANAMFAKAMSTPDPDPAPAE